MHPLGGRPLALTCKNHWVDRTELRESGTFLDGFRNAWPSPSDQSRRIRTSYLRGESGLGKVAGDTDGEHLARGVVQLDGEVDRAVRRHVSRLIGEAAGPPMSLFPAKQYTSAQ